MPIQAITTKIISTLGNKESLIPIMVKDGVDSASLTYKSFKEGGAVEGTDRFIDEFGTQAIWIGGIPFFKFLIDKTAYKHAKINPGVDPRIIADKEYSNWALNNAKGIMSNSKNQTVKNAISDCLKDGGNLAKNLFKGKVIAATALTLASFFLLTKTKQRKTKNTVLKEMNNEVNNSEIKHLFNIEENNTPAIFAEYGSNKEQKPSFKGFAKNLSEAIMFNPVHNMKIIDAGITSERLLCSRNKNEFAEHAIKEGGFLFFIYGFGNLIEKGINKFSSKVLKKPIDLPIDVIMDSSFAQALKEGKIAEDIAKMPSKDKSLTEKLNFIINEPENILVKAAKKAKIVSTVKDTTGKNIVDTSKYIDIKDLETLANNLLNIDSKYSISKEKINTFLNKTKALKVASVTANIGISCLFLGYIIPTAIYKYRQNKTGTTTFHVANDIRKNNKKDLS